MSRKLAKGKGRWWIPFLELMAVLAVLALPALDGWLGGRFWWIPALATFHFYWLALLAVPGLVVLLLLFLRSFRRRRASRHWPLALATLAGLALYGPQMVPDPFSDDRPAELPLTILTWNVHASASDPAEIRGVIESAAPDVVALQEVVAPQLERNGLIEQLREAGLRCEYRGYFADHQNTGIGLCVRPPVRILQASRRTYHEAGAWSYLFGEIEASDRVLNLVVPHFLAFRIKEEHPLRSAPRIVDRVRETVLWHRQEAFALLDLFDRLEDPTFLVGDFNSTPWQATHVALRRRLEDAFATAGLGFGATFRYLVPLRIDFVYVPRGARILDSRVGPRVSSDHRPVMARVDLASLPAGRPR